MEITEVRIKLMDDPHDRLQAFCSITFDECFVIRDLKIIQGAKGSFVAMPSRKLTDRCPRCHNKNHLRALHCNQCGAKLDEDRAAKDGDGRAKLYADIAHPINSECREKIQKHVLQAYAEEIVKAQSPDYVCTYDDYGEERYATLREPDEELDVEFASYRRGGESHRLEPAASQPSGPHHAASRPREERVAMSRHQSTSVGVETRPGRTSDDEDGFGAGII